MQLHPCEPKLSFVHAGIGNDCNQKSILGWSNLHQADPFRIVGAKLVLAVCGGCDKARWLASSLQGGQADLLTLAIKQLPRNSVERNAVFSDNERIRISDMFGPEAGPALVLGRNRVADCKPDLVANHGNAMQVGHSRITAS